MTENKTISKVFTEERYDRFYQIMDSMNIPDEDVRGGLDFLTTYHANNPKPSDNFAECVCIVAVAAYHAGKHAAE